MEEESESMFPESYAMKGGDGPCSYAQNSLFQRGAVEAAKGILKEEITMKLDIQKLPLESSKTFRVADFGCSSGPNSILAVQNILEAVELKFQSKSNGKTSRTPEYQVFFNDQVENDFNSLFALLPQNKQYYAAGVPGSFHGRLFAKASLHFVYSSCALNWLSKIPQEVLKKTSPAWNPRRIHYTGAPKEVCEAYSAQFARDMESFLNARAEELVGGGLMALLVPAVPDKILHSETTTGSEFELLGSCLMDMANMGKVSAAKVDTFNLPIYYTTPKELRQILERNGNGRYSVERMEILKTPEKHCLMPNQRHRTVYMRAVLEGLIGKHFGGEIMDELFERFSRKFAESAVFLNPDSQKAIVLFILLKRSQIE